MVPANILTSLVILMAICVSRVTSSTKLAWPTECKGKSYCHIKPAYYPTDKVENLLKDAKFDFDHNELSDRFGDYDDIANCPRTTMLSKVYLIMDMHSHIRFVAQNDDRFAFEIQVEECSMPGRTYTSFLDENKLRKQRVDCYQTRHPIKFPVLSLDGTRIESVMPKGGLPVSCSAKVIG